MKPGEARRLPGTIEKYDDLSIKREGFALSFYALCDGVQGSIMLPW
jgi:hypothetical protein